MPTCQGCGKKWSWKQTIKTIFKLKCPYCGKKQYESASSRIRSSIFMLIPLVFLPINAWLDFSVGIAFILAVIFALIIVTFYPPLSGAHLEYRRWKGKKIKKKGGMKSGLITLDNDWFYSHRICCSHFYEKRYGK